MEIDELVSNYRPSQAGVDAIKQSKMLLLAGITSAGKDTIRNRLVATANYYPIVTHTTRLPRSNNGVLEQDGVEYHFVSTAQMADLLVSHKIFEINHFGGNYYATSVEEFIKAKHLNKVAISSIDIHGIAAIHKVAPDNVTAIFIVPPDYDVWKKRIRNRYESVELFEADWQKRRKSAINELNHVLQTPYYHFVVNDDLDEAVAEVNDIVSGKGNHEREEKAKICVKDLLNAIEQDL